MSILQYLGHSAYYLEGENIKALIDPFFASDEAREAAAPYKEAGSGITYIFVTHAHGDHVGDTEAIAKATGATIFAVNELATHFANKGLKVEKMHLGGRGKFAFGSVKLTVAFHGSSMWEGGRMTFYAEPCGFVIEVGGKKIYHAGDTALTTEMSLLEAEGIDVALLPIGGYFTMDIDDAVRAAQIIKPKLAIPMHYDTFPQIKADPAEFVQKVLPHVSSRVLKIGEKMEL